MEESVALKYSLVEALEVFRSRCSTWETEAVREDRRQYCLKNRHLSVGLKEGEIRCVIVSHKGKYKNVSPFVISKKEIFSAEPKYLVNLCPIARIPFMMLFDPDYATGVNKTATALGNEPGKFMYGPIIFVLLDHEYTPTHMKTDFFKKHVLVLL